ncbi:hypothetical protein [Desulfovibrio fairfieldensis]|uniref:Uncharacterized protein n=1 Tax=Desulfovibrio fairfieldensis TaxID=44742 RepID=A0A0X8JHH6_9BACT|nr:hypothetical protein [Desulfovibrio fairfieldensis]AMD88914.1 hypothetical protein AXF13_01595 [Desulfovibrio fairfieldensis]
MGDSLRKVKQRIKAFLLFHGLEEPVGLERWTLSAVDALTTCEINLILRDVLDDCLGELRHLRVNLSVLEKKMAAHTPSVHQERLAALRSMPGVGRIVPVHFLRNVFALNDLNEGEK